MLIKLTPIALAISLSILLPACGGGSGGNSDNSSTATNTSQATNTTNQAKSKTISGVVASGKLSNMQIEAWENTTLVGTSNTDYEGEYSIKLNDNYQGGLVKLVAKPSTNSTLICDVPDNCGQTKYGSTTTIASSKLELSAFVVSNKLITISPFTTAVTKRAETLGVSEANVLRAYSELNNLVGFDVSTSMPSNNLAEGEGKYLVYRILNSALAQYAFTDANIRDIASVSDFANSFADGSIDNNDKINATTLIKSLEKINQDFIGKNITKDTLAYFYTAMIIKHIKDHLDINGSYNSINANNLSDTALNRARTTLKSIQSWYNSFFGDWETLQLLPKPVLDAMKPQAQELDAMLSLLPQVLDELNQADQLVNLVATGSINLTVLGNKLQLSFTEEPTGTALIQINSSDANPEFKLTNVRLELPSGWRRVESANLDLLDTAKAFFADNIRLSGEISHNHSTLNLNNARLAIIATGNTQLPQEHPASTIRTRVADAHFIGDIQLSRFADSQQQRFVGQVDAQISRLLNNQFNEQEPLSVQRLAIKGNFSNPATGESAYSSIELKLLNNIRSAAYPVSNTYKQQFEQTLETILHSLLPEGAVLSEVDLQLNTNASATSSINFSYADNGIQHQQRLNLRTPSSGFASLLALANTIPHAAAANFVFSFKNNQSDLTLIPYSPVSDMANLDSSNSYGYAAISAPLNRAEQPGAEVEYLIRQNASIYPHLSLHLTTPTERCHIVGFDNDDHLLQIQCDNRVFIETYRNNKDNPTDYSGRIEVDGIDRANISSSSGTTQIYWDDNRVEPLK